MLIKSKFVASKKCSKRTKIFTKNEREYAMIKRIKLHNYVYGFWFSVIEFAIMIAVIFPFMWYYIIHGRLLYGFISLGIELNLIIVFVMGLQSIFKKEKDIGMARFLNRKSRLAIYHQHPSLQRDTNILAVVICIPFLLVVFFVIDMIKAMRVHF
jgi:hypothetical protein